MTGNGCISFYQSIMNQNEHQKSCLVGAWGALAPPMFGQTVNPISTRRADYARQSTTSPPKFSGLATALSTLLTFPDIWVAIVGIDPFLAREWPMSIWFFAFILIFFQPQNPTWEHSHMTSDDLGLFLTYLPTLIRYCISANSFCPWIFSAFEYFPHPYAL